MLAVAQFAIAKKAHENSSIIKEEPLDEKINTQQYTISHMQTKV